MAKQRKHLVSQEYFKIKRALESSERFEHKILYIIFITGVRVSEALSLKFGDLDIAANCLHIRSLKGSNNRSIPLGAQALIDIVPIMSEAKKRNTTLGGVIAETPETTLQSQVRQIQRIWQKLCEKELKCYPITVHGLRHSFAMRLFEASNNNIVLVQKMLGHRRMDNTQKYMDYKNGVDCKEFVLKANGIKTPTRASKEKNENI